MIVLFSKIKHNLSDNLFWAAITSTIEFMRTFRIILEKVSKYSGLIDALNFMFEKKENKEKRRIEKFVCCF